MKLIRFELDGPKIGAIKGERVVELVAAGSRWSTVQAIAEAGPGAVAELESVLEHARASPALADLRLLAPIERPGKYLAIGMNYAKRLEEADKLGVVRSKDQTFDQTGLWVEDANGMRIHLLDPPADPTYEPAEPFTMDTPGRRARIGRSAMLARRGVPSCLRTLYTTMRWAATPDL